MKEYKKYIFHMDIDSFFAQAEEVRNPKYKNKPIGIGGKGKRSVIATTNYKARSLGIYAGMPVYKAKKIWPELIIIDSDYNYYLNLSNQIFSMLSKKYNTRIERTSIDECHIDMKGQIKHFKGDYYELGKDIQKIIYNAFNLTVSIGISDKKIFSKICTNFNKPNGITTLFTDEIKRKLYNKPINTLIGVGKKTKEQLNNIDIISIFDYILIFEKNELEITKLLGKVASFFYDQATGKIDDDVNIDFIKLKSISKDVTFDKELSSWDEISESLKKQVQLISNNLEQDSLVGNIIKVSLKYKKESMHSMQMNMKINTNDFTTIFHFSSMLFLRLWEKYNSIPIKFISIGVSELKNIYEIHTQLSIMDFDKKRENNKTNIQNIQNQINSRLKRNDIGIAYNLKKSNKLKNKNTSLHNGIKFKER